MDHYNEFIAVDLSATTSTAFVEYVLLVEMCLKGVLSTFVLVFSS